MQQGTVRESSVSFIIRMWDRGSGSEMRGEVEHLGTGERRLFVDASSLLRVIEEWRRDT